MKHLTIPRRNFTPLLATAVVMPISAGAAEPVTAELVSKRIQAALGGEWTDSGPDGFKAGEPSTVVKGIATTAMATIDVLKRAVCRNHEQHCRLKQIAREHYSGSAERYGSYASGRRRIALGNW